MPYYFIDFQDGDDLQRDRDGHEMESFERARAEAVALLPQVAKDELPDGEHRTFAVTLRDEKGVAVYRATLTFRGERLAN